jgi:hypothetical protein
LAYIPRCAPRNSTRLKRYVTNSLKTDAVFETASVYGKE